jgi:hypothetical protein
MAIPSIGSVSFSDLRAEYVGGTGSISLGDLYKGAAGSNSPIRDKASNNLAQDYSAGIPSSGAIAVNDFRGTSRMFTYVFNASAQNQNAQTLFGNDYTGDYNKDIIINYGVTLSNSAVNQDALTFPSGANGTIRVNLLGTITGSGGYGARNSSSSTIEVIGNGTFSGSSRTDFVSALQTSGGSVRINLIGGFGGASGSDIYHSDYGGGFNWKLVRSGNNFTAYWTYNELDYGNYGAGNYSMNTVLPTKSDGSFDDTITSNQQFSTNYNSGGRDTRNIAAGAKTISGVRYIWFASNNKSTSMEVQNNRYIQYGHTQTTLTTSNSQRSSVIQDYTGARSTGSFDTSGFTGTLS